LTVESNRGVQKGLNMARSDLLVALVRASATGDRQALQRTVEAIIAEERAKQHNVLASRLEKALVNGRSPSLDRTPTESSSRAREFIAEITPRRQLNDVILSETCRKAVDQLIEEQQRSELLRAHGLDPRHRVLLVGPPGNGKTSLAEAIAESLAVPFFMVRYEAIIGSYLGETASRLRRVFDYVRTTPCVLFFDEFDAIGKERGDIHETGEIKRVVSSLLMHIDDLPSYTVVIAATNHSELLDRAAWRRFQLRLLLPAPTAEELRTYFERFLASLCARQTVSAVTIARRLNALSYAEAEEFTLDIRRRDIMTMKERPLKQTIEEQLKLWEERVQPAATNDQEAEQSIG
jgi:SpoVK/Ycf46/Vps4 family AAA+-type ATPase